MNRDSQPVPATENSLAAIAAGNASLRAFVQVMPDAARAAALEAEQRCKTGASLGPLDGVSVAIKDNIDMAGLPTAGGIEHYRHAIAQRDAAIVQQLKAAGAVIVGKTNLHEAALGATTDNPWFGRCDNPRRAGYTPGGSSGGSGAAVAAAMCALALGTDTAGSVRIPASYCGVAGFKPSRGAISLEGVMPLSPTLDHVGLLAVSAAQIAAAWSVLAPAAQRGASACANSSSRGAAGLRLGIVRDIPDALASADLAALMASAAKRASDAGFALSAVSLAALSLSSIRRDAFVLCEIEAAAVHAQAVAANPAGFSPALRTMLAYGARQTKEREGEVRARLHAAAAQVRALLDGIDALLLPATAQAAFAYGTGVPDTQADFCALANIAGLPAISIPWSSDHAGMPLGLQIIGAAGQDPLVIEIACTLERAIPIPSGRQCRFTKSANALQKNTI